MMFTPLPTAQCRAAAVQSWNRAHSPNGAVHKLGQHFFIYF
jgi:hypothetical protein